MAHPYHEHEQNSHRNPKAVLWRGKWRGTCLWRQLLLLDALRVGVWPGRDQVDLEPAGMVLLFSWWRFAQLWDVIPPRCAWRSHRPSDAGSKHHRRRASRCHRPSVPVPWENRLESLAFCMYFVQLIEMLFMSLWCGWRVCTAPDVALASSAAHVQVSS